jgi:SAM-dependent methyltransferase
MTGAFKDHFSGHAQTYRQARPHYDPALFAWLAAQCAGHERAWDAGCGNGQASVALAAHFAHVVGTDPSAAQIANAQAAANVEYRVERAETPSLDDASVDLVTVAQALHWFDLEAFNEQVRRVVRPGGVVAQWSYADCRIDTAIDAVKNRLYVDVLDSYWAPERRLVESGYRELAFPFERIEVPPFELSVNWDLAQFLAYLRSWSATQKYIAAHGVDPVGELEGDFAQAWGNAAQPRRVVWDLAMRVGRV